MTLDAVTAAANRLLEHLESPDCAFWADLLQDVNVLLDNARNEEDARSADTSWFLATVAQARLGMIDAYQYMAQGAYKKAWDQLEQIELRVANLIDNPVLPLEPFEVTRLGNVVRSWQSLFPYRVFASPEFLHKRVECSICGEDVNPWSTCNHIVGKVYCGELCCHIVRDFEILGISLVNDPVQKYSAIIPYTEDGHDPLNYQRVAWVAERLSSPFAFWYAVETSKVFPHDRFNISDNDLCPCSSGMTYICCCKSEAGVKMPHTEIHFSEEIPLGLPIELLVHPATSKNSK